MNTTISSRRILLVLLTALGVSVAWLAFNLFFSAQSAHATERPAGLLGDLSEVVSSSTDAVVGTVNNVTEPVAPAVTGVVNSVTHTADQVVSPVVQVATPIPVVGPTAQHAVNETVAAATEVVQHATTPVTETLSDNPVGQVATPIVDSLEQLPLVGGLVTELNPALSSTVSGVDTVLSNVGEIAKSTVDSIASDSVTLNQTFPTDEVPFQSPQTDAVSPVLLGQTSPETVTTSISFLGVHSVGYSGSSTAASSAPDGLPFNPDNPGAPLPAAFPGPSSSSPSAGSGGGSGGISACLADTASQLFRAWDHVNGVSNDALPPAPVFDTDASPD